MKKFFGFASKKRSLDKDKLSKRDSTVASCCRVTKDTSPIAHSVAETHSVADTMSTFGNMDTVLPAKKTSLSKLPPCLATLKPVKLHDKDLPILLEYMKCINDHDVEAIRNVCSKDVSFDFIEAVFYWDMWEVELHNLFCSFPDFLAEWDDVVYGEDGAMIVREFEVSGTHTGAPYGFGPYPEIEAKGTKVKNDPEVLHFYFKDGKVSRIRFVTKGRMTGPPGFYTQLGGFALQ